MFKFLLLIGSLLLIYYCVTAIINKRIEMSIHGYNFELTGFFAVAVGLIFLVLGIGGFFSIIFQFFN